MKKKKSFFKSHERGFNMFSALVSAVLLMTGVVLINMLISTEDQIGSQLYLSVNSYQLSDVSSLVRADTIQSFNYYFRERVENFLDFSGRTDTTGFSIITTDNYDQPWDAPGGVKENFEGAFLLSNPDEPDKKFENAMYFVIDRTIDNFVDSSSRYGRYNFALSDRETSTKSIEAKRRTTDALVAALKEQEHTGRFLDIVDCSQSDCPVGTFYLNIPLSLIPEDVYNTLPKIIITDTITREEIKIGLLPKNDLKVYIPLRFFKAIFEAGKNADAIRSVEEELKSARLGYCNPSSCVPNSNPMSISSGNGGSGTKWNQPCAGGNVYQSLNKNYLGVDRYPLIGSFAQTGSVALTAFARDTICTAGVNIVTDSDSNDFFNTNLRANGLVSDNITPVAFPQCPFYSITEASNGYPTKEVFLVSNVYLYCGQIGTVYAEIIYKETNPLYIVSGNENYYKIRIAAGPFPGDSASIRQCSSNDTPSNKSCEVK